VTGDICFTTGDTIVAGGDVTGGGETYAGGDASLGGEVVFSFGDGVSSMYRGDDAVDDLLFPEMISSGVRWRERSWVMIDVYGFGTEYGWKVFVVGSSRGGDVFGGSIGGGEVGDIGFPMCSGGVISLVGGVGERFEDEVDPMGEVTCSVGVFFIGSTGAAKPPCSGDF